MIIQIKVPVPKKNNSDNPLFTDEMLFTPHLVFVGSDTTYTKNKAMEDAIAAKWILTHIPEDVTLDDIDMLHFDLSIMFPNMTKEELTEIVKKYQKAPEDRFERFIVLCNAVAKQPRFSKLDYETLTI
jgi:hypothetical protein